MTKGWAGRFGLAGAAFLALLAIAVVMLASAAQAGETPSDESQAGAGSPRPSLTAEKPCPQALSLCGAAAGGPRSFRFDARPKKTAFERSRLVRLAQVFIEDVPAGEIANLRIKLAIILK